ncbi:hypothetical protein BCR39DRAFT_553057 [Naematelia encephala]|uniref:Transglycosylase SLT domain-containing protein n=1 Tax=Naematelia encephala TaxID=71784 RepID=A0A1Y2AIJ1_9TREE|nr:hypothetical protein BCR39DRAFT_553057 [Naematelia encephala]
MYRGGFTLILALLPLLTAVAAGDIQPPHLRHRRLARSMRPSFEVRSGAQAVRSNRAHAEAHRIIKRQTLKRQQCRAKTISTASEAEAAVASSTSRGTAEAAHTTSTKPVTPASTSSASPKPTSTRIPSPSPSKSEPKSTASASDDAAVNINVSGLLSVPSSSCGPCPSTSDEPNGAQWWIDCGIDDSGWNPPFVTLDQIVTKTLSADGVFAACADYIDKFNSVGEKNGLPGILLASFAMQESTCNPNAKGANGEAGLMQIAPDNCEQGQDCWNIDYNIQRGAEIFNQYLRANGGSVFESVGQYNGWRSGMTVGDAEAAYAQGDCYAQNNLDYIYQNANGWWQGNDGSKIGSYRNLARCN